MHGPVWKAATRTLQTRVYPGHRHSSGFLTDRESPYLALRSARIGHAHGSGGRSSDLANWCTLPAGTNSLGSLAAEIIPRMFRIMKHPRDCPHLAGDGPRPVRAGSGLALGF